MAAKKCPIQENIELLDTQLNSKRKKAMAKAGYKAFGTSEIASFHGVIGSKNTTYVDAIRGVFLSPAQFIAEWKAGALAAAVACDTLELKKYGKSYQNQAVHRDLRWLQDPLINEYIELFLERNFYKQYHARTRNKPEDALWELWFGGKNQEYGLFISPRYDDGWENDVSEIRRVKFDYWTIGHVLESGFIIPQKDRKHLVENVDDLFQTYQNVFVRCVGSKHATSFAEAYEAFVRSQKNPESVPFMIPEFRYEGATGAHKYRLDFTILSASQNLKVGIELSPWSSHGRVQGKKKLVAQKGAGAVEAEQIKKWESDTAKRNDYFNKFGITTLTFTDSDLADIDSAFSRIKQYLTPPKVKRTPLPEINKAISDYRFKQSK